MEAGLIGIVKRIGSLLKEQGATLSVAESCTGGSIASTCISIPGASTWFNTGVVAYMEKSKEQVLGISKVDLSDGLVTERCAKAMALGIYRLTGSSYTISTTGISGPVESEGYPPCTAWIAVTKGGDVVATYLHQEEDKGRSENILQVTNIALRLLLKVIEDDAY